jgi:hypothetical protein
MCLPDPDISEIRVKVKFLRMEDKIFFACKFNAKYSTDVSHTSAQVDSANTSAIYQQQTEVRTNEITHGEHSWNRSLQINTHVWFFLNKFDRC